jgi:hypothetical protein
MQCEQAQPARHVDRFLVRVFAVFRDLVRQIVDVNNV